MTDDGDRFRAREKIAEILEPWFASRRIDDVERLFEDAGVLWGRYRTFSELVTADERVDPGVNPIWQLLDQPGIGRYPAPGSPLRFSEAGNVPPRPSPELGSNTEEVLREVLGLETPEIEQLRANGVL